MTDPPLRGLFVAANNPAVTCPDAGKVRQGLTREDLFTVVHDPFLSVTARYADIVLPATTYLETEDFYRAYGTYWMQYGRAAVPPQGEAWSNLRLAQELAQPHGAGRPGVPHVREPSCSPNCSTAPGAGRRGRSRRAALGPADALRRAGGAGIPHAVGPARILFGAAGRRRAGADAGLAARPRGGTRCSALAAAPVDRARLFPGAHGLCRGRIPAPPRGAAVLHPASR